jgi:hypothetical protein
LYNIGAGTYEPLGNLSMVAYDKLQKDKALESAVYVGEEWEVTPKLSFNAGIRYSMFNALGPRDYYTYQPGTLPSESTIADTVRVTGNKVLKTYHGPEFRLSGRYAFNDDFSVKAGFNTMRQYIHKVSNTSIMSPTDTWKLSDANIKPQQGWQVAGGFYYHTPSGMWEFALEGYYKKMKDYLDYRSGAKLLMNHHLETDVINTEGYAYGIELEVKKPKGKLNGQHDAQRSPEDQELRSVPLYGSENASPVPGGVQHGLDDAPDAVGDYAQSDGGQVALILSELKLQPAVRGVVFHHDMHPQAFCN